MKMHLLQSRPHPVPRSSAILYESGCLPRVPILTFHYPSKACSTLCLAALDYHYGMVSSSVLPKYDYALFYRAMRIPVCSQALFHAGLLSFPFGHSSTTTVPFRDSKQEWKVCPTSDLRWQTISNIIFIAVSSDAIHPFSIILGALKMEAVLSLESRPRLG